jgi:hypothetical protein
MTRESSSADFVVTKEHRRFAEFCDACRRYRYIGLCYGPPGVGKTLSARQYANWDIIEAYRPYGQTPASRLVQLVKCSQTVFYTPKVVNSPGEVERGIDQLRRTLRTIHLEPIEREETRRRKILQRKEKERQHYVTYHHDWIHDLPLNKLRPTFAEIGLTYGKKREATPDPMTLIIIDETDRLKMAALEQVRDIFDQGGMGVVLIGMPGMEKRLACYPQLYSRVGSVHAFRPLRAKEVRLLLQDHWTPSGGIVNFLGGLQGCGLV